MTLRWLSNHKEKEYVILCKSFNGKEESEEKKPSAASAGTDCNCSRKRTEKRRFLPHMTDKIKSSAGCGQKYL
jgi:hypothetical protein